MKFFFIYRALWTLNFSEGVSGQQLFLVTLNFLEFFPLQNTLDAEFFRRGVWTPNFFGHSKFEVKFLWYFLINRALLMLNFSKRGLGTNFFCSC